MALPPAKPAYILRGHGSSINAIAFVRENSRLVTGDAEGWIVMWDLATKRPTAVWRAHLASILGISDWGRDKIITHGKDNKLLVWKIDEEDEISMSTLLPLDSSKDSQKPPWLLYSLDVNTTNFCSFAKTDMLAENSRTELLIAVPDAMASEKVDIYHLPSSTKLHSIPASPIFKGGMVMSLSIFYSLTTNLLTVVTAFESGHTSVNYLVSPNWITIYIAKPHIQPVLSLAVSPSKDYYLTSSADAIIAKHMIPYLAPESSDKKTLESMGNDIPIKTLNTKHAGQQDLKIRNDGKIFATAGWDSRVRVYSGETLREVAVLKWHKEGCYAVAFANIRPPSVYKDEGKNNKTDSPISLIKSINAHVVEQVQAQNQVTNNEFALNISQERIWKSQNIHWIAVGSKDGKISLWDIY
ncbi:ASTRA-associated protein 1 [Golovinomyces cichoracearum]|uniref:ASTRA-associated protein 1 n=1 Tax=Golovinomyces cichoracearum TaxID=62708 RepID=A0A420IEJ6_9PEZI|nr:ASTRA-associated protein 1 [Golovinomyces cichoracearum]